MHILPDKISRQTWHFKVYSWVYGKFHRNRPVPSQRSICPYFWTVVFGLTLFPILYALLKVFDGLVSVIGTVVVDYLGRGVLAKRIYSRLPVSATLMPITLLTLFAIPKTRHVTATIIVFLAAFAALILVIWGAIQLIKALVCVYEDLYGDGADFHADSIVFWLGATAGLLLVLLPIAFWPRVLRYYLAFLRGAGIGAVAIGTIIGVILLVGRILKSSKVVAVDATGRARATFTVPVGPVGGSEDVPARRTKPSLLSRIGRGLKKAAERTAEAIVELCELAANFAAAKKAKFCPLVQFVD